MQDGELLCSFCLAFSPGVAFVQSVQPYSSTEAATNWKNFLFFFFFFFFCNMRHNFAALNAFVEVVKVTDSTGV